MPREGFGVGNQSPTPLTGPCGICHNLGMSEGFFDWRQDSNCGKLELEEYDKIFFPSNGRTIKRAKKICETCPVLAKCMDFALDTNAKGIWAGTTTKDRLKILAFRDQLNAPVAANPRRSLKKVTRKNFTVA